MYYPLFLLHFFFIDSVYTTSLWTRIPPMAIDICLAYVQRVSFIVCTSCSALSLRQLLLFDIHFGLFQVPFQDTNFSRRDISVFSGFPFNCSSTIRENEMELKAYATLVFKVYKIIFYKGLKIGSCPI